MEANMTVREVAVKLGVTFTHVYNLVRAERLPGAFKADGEWKVPQAALNAYLERRKRRERPVIQSGKGGTAQVKVAA
jgi:excisionase family DNA binding protein